MIKQLIKVPRKVNCVVLGVLLQFMFSNVMLASEGKTLSAVKSQFNQQITVSVVSALGHYFDR